jgi:RNA polymerase sigma factor (sigma-70 family)
MEDQEFKEKTLYARLDRIPNRKLAVTDYDPAEEDYKNGIKEKVNTLVSRLPFKERVILRLSFGLGEYNATPLREIALDLGINDENAAKLKENALKKLKEELDGTVVF